MAGIDLLSCVRSLSPNHHHLALFLLSLFRWPRDDKPYSTACRNAKVKLRQISKHLEKFQQPNSFGHLNFFLYLCISLIFFGAVRSLFSDLTPRLTPAASLPPRFPNRKSSYICAWSAVTSSVLALVISTTHLWVDSSTHSGSFITVRALESKIFLFILL